jgi:hypothetical protein
VTTLQRGAANSRRGSVVGVLIGIALAAGCAYQMLFPWPVASAVLAKFGDRAAIPITFRASGSGFRRESYILIPSLREVTIEVSAGQPPQVQVTSRTTYVIVCSMVFGLYIAIFVWRRRGRAARSVT